MLMLLPSVDPLHLAWQMLKCTLEDYCQYTHQNFIHTGIHEIDQL